MASRPIDSYAAGLRAQYKLQAQLDKNGPKLRALRFARIGSDYSRHAQICLHGREPILAPTVKPHRLDAPGWHETTLPEITAKHKTRAAAHLRKLLAPKRALQRDTAPHKDGPLALPTLETSDRDRQWGGTDGHMALWSISGDWSWDMDNTPSIADVMLTPPRVQVPLHRHNNPYTPGIQLVRTEYNHGSGTSVSPPVVRFVFKVSNEVLTREVTWSCSAMLFTVVYLWAQKATQAAARAQGASAGEASRAAANEPASLLRGWVSADMVTKLRLLPDDGEWMVQSMYFSLAEESAIGITSRTPRELVIYPGALIMPVRTKERGTAWAYR